YSTLPILQSFPTRRSSDLTATELEQDQTYILNQGYTPILGGGAEYYLKLSNTFSTNTTQTGELTITRNDMSNSIISGIFWFDAINDAGEVVKISEGRFRSEERRVGKRS